MSILVGKKAPKFSAKAVINGGEFVEDFSLEQFIGKRPVILFFYPKDLGAVTENITVTDENGCQDTSNVVIEEPAGLIITETTADALCLGGNNGTVSLIITGGTGPFFTDWNGIDTNALGAGTYPYTVTDANGCQVFDSITINDPDPLSIDTQIAKLRSKLA